MERDKPASRVPAEWISEGTSNMQVKGHLPALYHRAEGVNMVSESVLAIVFANLLSVGAVMPFVVFQELMSRASADTADFATSTATQGSGDRGSRLRTLGVDHARRSRTRAGDDEHRSAPDTKAGSAQPA